MCVCDEREAQIVKRQLKKVECGNFWQNQFGSERAHQGV